MAGGGGGTESGEPEFQIAPMIDVLLVLLIFFMSIMTAEVLRVDREIKLPSAPDALKRDSARSEAIVNVRWAGSKAVFTMEEKTYEDMGELSKALAEAKKVGDAKGAKGANPNFRVVIRGDRETPARQISRVMDAAAQAGLADVTFSATSKEALQ